MTENPNKTAFRQELKEEGLSWQDLVGSLGSESEEDTHRTVTPKPEPAPEKDAPAPEGEDVTRSAARSRYEQLCKNPSMPMESGDRDVMLDFSEIISKVNATGRVLSRLREKHPEAMPERILHTLRDNLKETSTVMLKELHNMRNGRGQKKYEKKYVCKSCHSVFMVPLPKDGFCDECRAGFTPRSAPY